MNKILIVFIAMILVSTFSMKIRSGLKYNHGYADRSSAISECRRGVSQCEQNYKNSHTKTVDDGCGKSHTELDSTYSADEMKKNCSFDCDSHLDDWLN